MIPSVTLKIFPWTSLSAMVFCSLIPFLKPTRPGRTAAVPRPKLHAVLHTPDNAKEGSVLSALSNLTMVLLATMMLPMTLLGACGATQSVRRPCTRRPVCLVPFLPSALTTMLNPPPSHVSTSSAPVSCAKHCATMIQRFHILSPVCCDIQLWVNYSC